MTWFLFPFLRRVTKNIFDCSAERSKYELRVRSYRNDKKQLDAELDKAVQRLKDNASRDELMAYDNQISVNQVGIILYFSLFMHNLLYDFIMFLTDENPNFCDFFFVFIISAEYNLNLILRRFNFLGF